MVLDLEKVKQDIYEKGYYETKTVKGEPVHIFEISPLYVGDKIDLFRLHGVINTIEDTWENDCWTANGFTSLGKETENDLIESIQSREPKKEEEIPTLQEYVLQHGNGSLNGALILFYTSAYIDKYLVKKENK